MIQDVVNGVIQLVIGVATLVAIVGGALFVISGMSSSKTPTTQSVRSPKIVFDSEEHAASWVNRRAERKR